MIDLTKSLDDYYTGYIATNAKNNNLDEHVQLHFWLNFYKPIICFLQVRSG